MLPWHAAHAATGAAEPCNPDDGCMRGCPVGWSGFLWRRSRACRSCREGCRWTRLRPAARSLSMAQGVGGVRGSRMRPAVELYECASACQVCTVWAVRVQVGAGQAGPWWSLGGPCPRPGPGRARLPGLSWRQVASAICPRVAFASACSHRRSISSLVVMKTEMKMRQGSMSITSSGQLAGTGGVGGGAWWCVCVCV